MRRYDPFKRAIDVLVGGIALIVSLPVQLALASVVRRKLGSPVLFRQLRPGKDAFALPRTGVENRMPWMRRHTMTGLAAHKPSRSDAWTRTYAPSCAMALDD